MHAAQVSGWSEPLDNELFHCGEILASPHGRAEHHALNSGYEDHVYGCDDHFYHGPSVSGLKWMSSQAMNETAWEDSMLPAKRSIGMLP